MIRRLRYALTIVRDLSMILCPASASVRAEVVARRAADLLAADYLTEREAAVDVMEPWSFPAAGVAAGTSSGAVSMFPVVPAPERPDLLLQAMAIEELYAHHQPDQDSPSTIRCHGCGHIAHSERRHWRHVTELVTDMVTTDYRIQQLLNK